MTAPRPPRWTPAELAVALRLPPPTREQAEVIGAPLGPAVVVAGAGSGKTETMSARVVWLVANELVRPDQVLGLTFTTKAAGELGTRIRTRLAQLRTFLGGGPAGDPLLAGEPTVSTYHGYAGRLVAEHALRLGVEPSVRLLTEAMTWQLAQRVVRTYDLDVPELDNAEATVVGWVLDLAGELAEHLVEPDALRRWTAELRELVLTRPRRSSTGRGALPTPAGEPYAEVRKLLDKAASRVALLPLVERYVRAKKAARAMDFGDQVAIAARVADGFAEVGRGERSRYGVVLLDEYQDTGHAQLTLLRALYGGGHPVTAVGDPAQAIYGWRGASAANLRRFAEHFRTAEGAPAPVLPLSVSFRNDELVLDVANDLSADLREHGIDVGVLAPGPRGGPGLVRCALVDTVLDEAEWLAAQVAEVWDEDAAERRVRRPGRSVAVLCRRRSQFEVVARALRARGIPVELVGLGGLLATPEVRDLLSTLQVVSDPTAGAALVRLLTGARWRIGPRDIAALGRRARSLAARRSDAPAADAVLDPVADASLVEALDDLGPPAAYSAAGHRRMAALGAELAALRRRTAQPLPDLVADVERTLLLDVEAAAAPDRDSAAGRAHLDRFAEVATDFSVDAEVPTLGAFLAYLAAAEDAERGLEAGLVEVEADRVQVLTVHAAKGLEWDVVAVPGLTAGVFPDRDAAGSSGWATSACTLPYPLRGDGADLPVFAVGPARDQKAVEEARKDFVEACKERGHREERRLAYVAVTRARQRLLCSGYWWDAATRPRGPSTFLAEISRVRGVRVDGWEPPPADGAGNPMPPPRPVPWPADPLGARRPLVEQGAALVRAALAAGGPPGEEGTLFAEEDLLALGWAREAELLLAERARGAGSGTGGAGDVLDVPMPGHLSVTDLVSLARDPFALARRVRRPLPTRPAPLARRGTAFHAWLEERYGGERLLDLDELPGAADAGAAPDSDLALLQERFLASAWAERSPDEVEVAFETMLGGVVVRGRIDAVFADPDGGWTVVDWKTGDPPRDPSSASVQLAAYRLAWAELSGTPVELVRAAFHYVRADRTTAPVDLLDADRLRELVDRVPVGRS